MKNKIAIAQSNSIVGFLDANIARITALYDIAVLAKSDLLIFPEMNVTGYPLEDLALSKQFQQTSLEAIEKLAKLTLQGTAMLVGGVYHDGDSLYNSVFLLDNGEIIHQQSKHHLPNYGVFDEKRIFASGLMPNPIKWRGQKLGLLICEDMWQADIATHLKNNGAELLIAINASPYEIGKAALREQMALQRVKETTLPLIYVNMVGGQDDLVFDGGSFALSEQGDITLRMQSFQDDFALIDSGIIQPHLSEEESIYRAMMLGLRDFVSKNGFSGIVIGMSGGIDSAMSASVACDAIGKESVRLIMMKSPFTSQASIDDASEFAQQLGINLEIISIESAMNGFEEMVKPLFKDEIPAVTSENNQTRLRMSVLTAIAERENLLLLNTGNKSEIATGYTNLYGDMCGHYSVLKDIYKTQIYKLAKWRGGIADNIINKPPTAELNFTQKDQDTLPPYELLDKILFQMVEQNLSVLQIVKNGFDKATVDKVSQMLFASEYKRRQSCPGVKISSMSFYRDRRYPLTNAYHKLGSW